MTNRDVKCGCKIVDVEVSKHGGLRHYISEIEYCLLHAAAPELLTYVKRYHETLSEFGHKDRANCCKLSKLITAAEGGTK